jgi:hypothetical protein
LLKNDPGEQAVHVEMLFELFSIAVTHILTLVHPPATNQLPGGQEQRLLTRMNPGLQAVQGEAPIVEFHITLMHLVTSVQPPVTGTPTTQSIHWMGLVQLKQLGIVSEQGLHSVGQA